MKEYRFLKYSINLATILVMSMIIFLIGIFLSFTIFQRFPPCNNMEFFSD